MKLFLVLTFYIASLQVSVLGQLRYSKCCEDGQELGEDKLSCQPSVSTTTLDTAFNYLGVNLEQAGIGFPKRGCPGYEAFHVSGGANKISADGNLITTKFKKPFPLSILCLDIFKEEVYAVTCDRCRSGVPCISLCCPAGQIVTAPPHEYYNYDETTPTSDGSELIEPRTTENTAEGSANVSEYEYEQFNLCSPTTLDLSFNLEFWKQNEVLSFEEDKHYYLVTPPGDSFKCAFDPVLNEEALFIPHLDSNLSNTRLLPSGVLDGVIDDSSYKVKILRKLPGDFCVSYEQNTDGQLISDKIYYGICTYEPAQARCESVRFIVFNVGFIISLIFIILTFIAHLIEPALRDSAFGKITIGYLVNLFLAFFFILNDRIQGYREESTACILTGYLKQYTYISFFTWVNAMAIFLCVTLGSMKSRSIKSWKAWAKILAYTQGLPLIICLVTFGVDEHLKEKLKSDPSADRLIYPEMGTYTCYVGYQQSPENPSYFKTPEFIYVQFWVMLMLMVNIIMFCKISHKIVSVRSNARKKNDNCHDNLKGFKEDFIILLKLFVYMVCVWIFEIVTSAIAAEHGLRDTCTVRFILDTPNAFYGLIIFLVLICGKKNVRIKLSAKVTNAFSSGQTETTSTSNGHQRSTTSPKEPSNSGKRKESIEMS